MHAVLCDSLYWQTELLSAFRSLPIWAVQRERTESEKLNSCKGCIWETFQFLILPSTSLRFVLLPRKYIWCILIASLLSCAVVSLPTTFLRFIFLAHRFALSISLASKLSCAKAKDGGRRGKHKAPQFLILPAVSLWSIFLEQIHFVHFSLFPFEVCKGRGMRNARKELKNK